MRCLKQLCAACAGIFYDTAISPGKLRGSWDAPVVIRAGGHNAPFFYCFSL